VSLDAAGSSPETVLCIDDEDNQLLLRKLLLEEAGYRVFTATSGEEGIRVFQAEQVDVVIVDYWMSRMNGLVVARALKTLRSIIPIIMLSGYAELPPTQVSRIGRRFALKKESCHDYAQRCARQDLVRAGCKLECIMGRLVQPAADPTLELRGLLGHQFFHHSFAYRCGK